MATSTLGRLTLDLAVKIGSYVEGMSKAERKTKDSTKKMGDSLSAFKAQVSDAFGGTQLGSVIDNFNGKLGSLKGNIGVTGAAIAGMAAGGALLGAAALSKMAIETAKADMQLQVLADRANTSVQNFQILEQAALGFGVSQDQLGSILADVQEKLGEFSATEGGGAADFFDALKNNTKMSEDQIRSFAKTLQGKDGVEAIQLLNDKMDELGATSQERRFVFESLASDLGNLAPLFAQNGAMLNEFGAALEEAGVLKTQEAMEQSRLLAAQTQTLDLQFQGMKNQLVSAVMPAVSSLMGLFIDTTNSAVGLNSGVSIVSIGMNAFAGVVVTAAGVLRTLFSIARESMVQLINVGSTLYNVVTAGSIGGAIDALKTGANVAKQSLFAVGTTALDSGKKAVAAFSGTTSAQNKLTQAILKSSESTRQNNTGLKVNTKQADDNAKAKSKLAKAESNYNKVLQERERIIYDYASADGQRELDLAKEMARLQGAGMGQFMSVAQARFDQEKKLAEMQFAWDLTEHRYTEIQKLAYSYNIKEQEILADKKLTKEQRELKLASLKEQFQNENKLLQISEQKHLLEIQKTWMSASEYAEKYYALVREEILNTTTYSPEMKNALVKEANIQQGVEQNAGREQTWSDYQSRFGETNEYQADLDLLKQAREQMLVTEQEYFNKRAMLQMQFGSAYMSSTADVLKSVLGEESAYYQAAFAMAKGMAVAKVALNAPETYSNVYNALAGIPYVGPYIAPVVAAGAVAVQLAQAALVGNVSFNAGFADGGFTGFGGKYEPAGIVHKGEGVLTQEEIKILGGPSGFYALRNAIRKGYSEGGIVDAPKVVNPYKNTSVTTTAEQQNREAAVTLNPNFVIVDERANVGDYLFSSDGTKAFVKFFKRNRATLGV